jgi:cytochrome c peroxidase
MKKVFYKICRRIALTLSLVLVLSCFAFSADMVAQQLTKKQQLGKSLFFDTNLSTPAGQACATCHSPQAGFADPRSTLPVSEGAIPGRVFYPKAPSAAYAAYSPALFFDTTPSMGNMMQGWYRGGQFWDGRADTLKDQAKQPLLNPLEMHNPNERAVIVKVRASTYADLFKEVFGPDALSLKQNNIHTAYNHVVEAIAEYERSSEVCQFSSKYDHHLADPAGVPLTDSEAHGIELFTGKANCVKCHFVDTNNLAGKPLFTSFGYQNIGVPKNPDNPFYKLPKKFNPDGANFVDIGLGNVIYGNSERGRHKIPSLRNVATTAPYMHSGVFKTLREVLEFDNTRDVGNWPLPEVNENVHRHMPPMPGFFGQLGLTDQEIEDIIAFLQTLTDGYVKSLL